MTAQLNLTPKDGPYYVSAVLTKLRVVDRAERLAKRAGPLTRSDRVDTTSGLGPNAL